MKASDILPFGAQMLIKQDPEESRESAHGVITPGMVEQEQKAVGTVLAVGPDVKRVAKGDRLIYPIFAGERLEIHESGKESKHVILHEDEVLALLKKTT